MISKKNGLSSQQPILNSDSTKLRSKLTKQCCHNVVYLKLILNKLNFFCGNYSRKKTRGCSKRSRLGYTEVYYAGSKQKSKSEKLYFQKY